MNFKMSHVPGAREPPGYLASAHIPHEYTYLNSGAHTARPYTNSIAGLATHHINPPPPSNHERVATLADGRAASTEQFLMSTMLTSSGPKKGSMGSIGGYSKAPSSGAEGSTCPLSMKTIAIPERRHGTLAPKTTRADLGLPRCASGA